MGNNSAKFITVEGIDGTGKSTVTKLISDILMNTFNIPCHMTREPGGSDIAEDIRDCFLKNINHHEEPMDTLTQLLLMYAARKQHIETTIIPSLMQGIFVVCDRFVDSTYAYQGGGYAYPISELDKLNKLILNNFEPNITILLDADPRDINHRTKGRDDNNALDYMDYEFKTHVRNEFLRRYERTDTKTVYLKIDATQSLQDIEKIITDFLSTIINKTS